MAGEDKCVDIVLDLIWKLKQVGVSVWFTGHTKRRTVTDVSTGTEYETLTSNMSTRYFNAIKTKLHVLGVASIDRDIEKIKQKQKIGNDKIVGKVKNEQRVIVFRDDNFNIDAKSRFADIVDRIPLDADEFIKALEDAIKASFKQQKTTKTIEQVAKEQEVEFEQEQTKKAEEAEDVIHEMTNEKLMKEIVAYVRGDEADDDVVGAIGMLFKETGHKMSEIDVIPTSVYRKAVALIG